MLVNIVKAILVDVAVETGRKIIEEKLQDMKSNKERKSEHEQ